VELTDVRVRRISSEGKMKAVASVTFDDLFVVHDIKIIEGQSGLFIAMPSRKTPSGEFRDIAHPIKPEMRDMLQKRILEQYESLEEVVDE
jgi:stage V sporulation protein G